MKAITEKDGIQKEWYEEARAKEMTMETLPAFLKKLTTEYDHDYGTICHAIAAGGIATMWAMNRSAQGGITGFQAGCIMWEFLHHWHHVEGPARLLQYDDMLFPQNADKFEKTITPRTAKRIKELAEKKLKGQDGAHPNVLAHWHKVAAGEIPFGYVVKEN